MEIVQKIKPMRKIIAEARRRNMKIGLVPTMGALHSGHISLIKEAIKKTDFVVVTIFVNPTQFVQGDDFQRYPRPLEDDIDICQNEGVHAVFIPTAEHLYNPKHVTWVDVDKLTLTLCGKCRPGHFRGVTTICSKLFNIVMPDEAFFGQKDVQQAFVIKRMVEDLNFPIKISICPTVRERSGLAISSRNQYLTEEQKSHAPLIYKALRKARRLTKQGIDNPIEIIGQMTHIIREAPEIEVEYIGIVDAETFQPLDSVNTKAIIAVAAKVGSARLIDNIIVDAAKK
jgi:pantoate--beta-alanine ligase